MAFIAYICVLKKQYYMTNKEFFVQSWKRDSKITAKAFGSLPTDLDKLNMKHHPKFRSPWELVNHIGPHGREVAQAFKDGRADLVNEGNFPLTSPTIYKNLAEAANDVEASAAQIEALATACDENTWMTKNVDVYWNGNKIFSATLMQFAWTLLHDTIHHRGQLTSYYRIIGATQPSLMGPTREEEDAMMAAASN
jgi:uncharacterized damage-inducible protein DinB